MSKRTLSKLPLTAAAALTAAFGCLFALLLCLLFAFAASAAEDPTAHLSLYGEIAFGLSMLFCGFVGALLKIMRMVEPTHAAVLFDGEHGTERNILSADYKANRQDLSAVAKGL